MKQSVRVNLSASRQDGDVVCMDRPVSGFVAVKPLNNIGGYKEVVLQLLLPSNLAEEVGAGLIAGMSELSVEQIPSVLERTA